MRFRRVDYIEWARAHMDDPSKRHSLASSAVAHLQPADLGLELDGLTLTAPTAMGLPELVSALCDRYGVVAERLLLTAGCTLGNFLLCAALLEPGDRVIVERPVYEPLWRNVEALGGRIAWLRRDAGVDYRVDIGRLERLLRQPAKLVVLTNLHNPSGRYTPPEDVERIGALARARGAMVLWDEVYLESVTGDTVPAALVHPRGSISTLSLDKCYGLGQLKVGWCIAPPRVIKRARQVADYLLPNNPPLLERVGLVALQHIERLRAHAVTLSTRGRERAARWIAERGDLEWSHPDGGFVGFARFRNPDWSSRALEPRLAASSTLVVPGHFFADPRGFRLGFGVADPERLEAGLAALGAVLDLGVSNQPRQEA